jgi:hypothetical protein
VRSRTVTTCRAKRGNYHKRWRRQLARLGRGFECQRPPSGGGCRQPALFPVQPQFQRHRADGITFRAWGQTTGADGALVSTAANGGTTAFSTATDTASITITAVKDAPMATNLNAPQNYIEDTPLDLTDIVVSDVDSPNVTATLTLSNTVGGCARRDARRYGHRELNSGTRVLTISGTIADVNATLANATFTPTLNFNGPLSIAPA